MVWFATSWEPLGPAIALHSCIMAKEYEAMLQEQVRSVLQTPLRYDIPVLQCDNLPHPKFSNNIRPIWEAVELGINENKYICGTISNIFIDIYYVLSITYLRHISPYCY